MTSKNKKDKNQEFFTGPTGATGPMGPQGPKGLEGPEGLRGPRGAPGLDGLVGIAGPRGPRGPKGADGPTGIKGERGIKGETGDKGEKGIDSEVQGPDGAVGSKGPVGDQGEKGEQGEKGDVGDTGNQGSQGPQGPKGLQGRHGNIITPYLTITSLTPQSYTANKNNLIPKALTTDNLLSGDSNVLVRSSGDTDTFSLTSDNKLVLKKPGFYQILFNLYAPHLQNNTEITLGLNDTNVKYVMNNVYFYFSRLVEVTNSPFNVTMTIVDTGKNNVNQVDSSILVRLVSA